MLTGDKAAGMAGPIAEAFPEAAYRRRAARFHRDVLARVPRSRRGKVAAMLRAVRAMESREAGEAKALEVAAGLGGMGFGEAARAVRDGCAEALTCTRFPRGHRGRIRANDAIERLDREVGRRMRAVGTFPDGKSAPMPVTAGPKYVAGSEWGSRRYLDVTLLDERPHRRAGLQGCRKVRKILDGTGRWAIRRLLDGGNATEPEHKLFQACLIERVSVRNLR